MKRSIKRQANKREWTRWGMPLRPWEEQCGDCGVIFNHDTGEGLCMICAYSEDEEGNQEG